jgi:hypothetical protein
MQFKYYNKYDINITKIRSPDKVTIQPQIARGGGHWPMVIGGLLLFALLLNSKS